MKYLRNYSIKTYNCASLKFSSVNWRLYLYFYNLLKITDNLVLSKQLKKKPFVLTKRIYLNLL